MKVFRYGKHVKTVPKEFESVLEVFFFTSENKRLSNEERDSLSKLLTTKKTIKYLEDPSDYQKSYALTLVKLFGISNVICVSKRDGRTLWRIKIDGIYFNTPHYVISDWPKHLILEKNEL